MLADQSQRALWRGTLTTQRQVPDYWTPCCGDGSLDFHTRLLGMDLMRMTDYPDGRLTLAFVGYGDEGSNAVIAFVEDPDGYKVELIERGRSAGL
jgi:catechol 2,3-dioxygenase-like lactoylglutathione lyase family enzyme